MTQTQTTASTTDRRKRAPRPPLNGVDTPLLLGTIDAVGAQPELAEFQFRATNRWQSGTHSVSTMEPYAGAGGEHAQTAEFRYDADHPPVLCGAGRGPTPVEFLLHAIAACLTAGIANVAAARGVALRSVTSRVEGDINLLGIFGLSGEVRNGYRAIRVAFEIEGDASPETLEAIVAQSRARSAVFDVLSNGTPVEVSVEVR